MAHQNKSVLKFHPSGMNSCWEILDEYLFENLGKNKKLKFLFNRALTSDSFKNESYRLAYIYKECVKKIYSSCEISDNLFENEIKK